MQKKLFILCGLTATALLLLFACKRELLPDPEAPVAPPDKVHQIVRGAGSTSPRSDEQTAPKPMLIGAKRANPFKRSVMTQAWNALYEPDVAALPVTDLYVRFKPANLDELRLLEKAGLELFSFPLDHEIVSEGNYYHDPAIPEDQITWQYAVVKPGFQFPAVQYEVLEEIINAPFKSALTRKAFEIAGVNYLSSSNRDGECTPQCLNYPECLEQIEVGCGGEMPTGEDGDTQFQTPACGPDSPDWPQCLMEVEPYTPLLNNCGCPSSNSRQPAGCIKVVDTQLPANSNLPGGQAVHLDGVKQAKVVWWNGWFGVWTAETDDNGCWVIPNEDYGNGWMWVRFKNDRATVRGFRSNPLEYAFAVTDKVGKIGGPAFNNIEVVYNAGNTPGSDAWMYWTAATASNALWDYHQFAAADNITPPQQGIDILLTPFGGGCAAPMLDKSGMAWQLYGNAQVFIGAIAKIPGVGVILSPILNGLALFAATYAPDVILNLGDWGQRSDRIKEVCYHEFGHAAHFAALQDNEYWKANVWYIVGNWIAKNNSPYGTRGTPGFQRCAIIEMWGEHIGPVYADRKYGVRHSLGGGSQQQINNARWLYQLERFTPDILGNSELDAYIPNGLFLDLQDNNNLNPPNVTDPVFDVMSNLSQQQCFHSISHGQPELMSLVKNKLIFEAGQNGTTVSDIFAQYGY